MKHWLKHLQSISKQSKKISKSSLVRPIGGRELRLWCKKKSSELEDFSDYSIFFIKFIFSSWGIEESVAHFREITVHDWADIV